MNLKYKSKVGQIIDEVYKKGFEAGKKSVNKSYKITDVSDLTYQAYHDGLKKGQNEVWDLIRLIITNYISSQMLLEIFKTDSLKDILRFYSPDEVIKNIDLYLNNTQKTENQNKKWIPTDIIIKQEKYKNFVFFKEAQSFSQYFRYINYDVVQVYDLTPISDSDIVGFAGVFEWKNGKIISLDGDSYDDPEIWGFKEFSKDGKQCLNILATQW